MGYVKDIQNTNTELKTDIINPTNKIYFTQSAPRLTKKAKKTIHTTENRIIILGSSISRENINESPADKNSI